MKKLLCLFLVFACVLTMGTVSAFAQNVPASADTPTIQPRLNVVEVLSYQEYLTDRNGNSVLVLQRHRRLTYVNGYEISLIQPENITTIGDQLNGATRKSYTYSYRTW